MNTAPKLPDQLLAWNVRNALGPYNDDDMPLIDLIIQLRNKLAALAPPSGEGVGLTVADAWFESPTEITIHAKASGGAKLPEEGTKIYTTPPPASQERGGKPWRCEWEGSGPQCGWHIVEAVRLSNNEHVAYLGQEIGSTAVDAIVAAHNATQRPAECADGCPPQQVCDFCQGTGGVDASPPSSAAAAKEPEQRCPYCAGLIYSAAGCQNCKVGSVWPKPIAAEQDSSAAEDVPDFWVREDSLAAMAEDYVCNAAEQAKPVAINPVEIDSKLIGEQAQAGEDEQK